MAASVPTQEEAASMMAAKLATLPKGANQHSAMALSTPTQEEAASMMDVSVDSVKRARKAADVQSSQVATNETKRAETAVSSFDSSEML